MARNFQTQFSLNSFVEKVNLLTDSRKKSITQMGFGNVLEIPKLIISKNLLAELMERWCPQQLAFILPPGNILITEMDIALILGLSVKGKPVTLEQDISFSELEESYGACKWNRKISIGSLKVRLGSPIDEDDFFRTFLLFMFGVVLFPSSTDKVDLRYLSFLVDLDKVRDYAWGKAVLDDVINWLHKRKEQNVQNIGGCLIFLQIWCFEHIEFTRPRPRACSLFAPRVCRWDDIKKIDIMKHDREWHNTKFEEVGNNQIIWELKPTPIEEEFDIVKELLEARSSSTISGDTHLVREVTEGEDSMELTPPHLLLLLSEAENASTRIPEVTSIFAHDEEEECATKKLEVLEEENARLKDEEEECATKKLEVLEEENTRLKDEEEECATKKLEMLEEEIARLKMENERLRNENELLKNLTLSTESLFADFQDLILSNDSLCSDLQEIITDLDENVRELPKF